MEKYSYKLETFYMDKWLAIKNDGLQFLLGFMASRSDSSPRNAYRIVRSDGKIVEELPGRDDVHIGMVAGWPTAEQYERAAERALEKARIIRAREERERLTVDCIDV